MASQGFGTHKILKLSASLSFATIFSLGPMMMVVIFFANLFWERDAVEGVIYKHINGIVGEESAIQIQEIIKNASIKGHNFMAVVSFIILIITATTVFTEIQDSINTIWSLSVKKNRGWMQILKIRLLSFAMVTGMGFLLLVSLLINVLLEGFMDKLHEIFPHMTVVLAYILNLLITLLVVAFLFALIYKLLPDAVIRWKDVMAGALFAGILFMLGKFAITFYIKISNLGSAYGSAGSLVILLLWVFYSSLILYYGAEFTKAYSLKYGATIKPKEYAVTVKMVEIRGDAKSVQENEKR
ncbi:MAG: ribonuclease [Bacteroidetes bacterium]|nr:ribonuclease [Bacteroidota bacterium]